MAATVVIACKLFVVIELARYDMQSISNGAASRHISLTDPIHEPTIMMLKSASINDLCPAGQFFDDQNIWCQVEQDIIVT